MGHKHDVGGKPYQPSPRVPALPNEINASGHVTGKLSSEALSYYHTGKHPEVDSWRVRSVPIDPSTVRVLTVEEPTKYASNHKLIKLVKDHELELERIDQELLELGPFAKDTYIPENSHTRQDVCLPPAPQYTHPTRLTSPTDPPRRGPRKRSTLSTTSVPSPKQSRRGSQGLGERSVASPSTLLKQTTEDKESVKEPTKRRWRKVGSSGSSSSRAQSTDSKPSSTPPVAMTPPMQKPPDSIIPAASEKEMLSLYLPYEFEAAVSSPMERSSSAMSESPMKGGDKGSVSAVQREHHITRSEGSRTFTSEHFHPVQTVSSSTPSSLTTVARYPPNHHPSPQADPKAASVGSSGPQQSDLIVVDDSPTSAPRPASGGSHTPGSGTPTEFPRHIVVSGGVPVTKPSFYTRNSQGSPRPRLDDPLRGPVALSETSRVARSDRMSCSPQLPPGFQPSPFIKRRNSSASSFASHDSLPVSFKQPPRGGTENGDKDPKVPNVMGIDPKVGGVNPYVLPKPPEGAPAIPGLYPSPFFPILNPPGGVMVPPFAPNMFIDPTTGVLKQSMYGSPLIPYRYPFSGAPNLKPFQSPTPPPPGATVAGGAHPSTPAGSVGYSLGSQQSLYPLPSSPGMSAFKNVQDARSSAATPPLFVRVGSSPLSRDENRQTGGEDKPPGINWNPALIGPNVGLMPFPLGIGVPPTSLTQPSSMMNLFNPVLHIPGAPGLANTAANSEGNIAKLVGSQDQGRLSQRHGSVSSVDGSSRDHPRHQPGGGAAPIAKVPSAGVPLQMTPHPFSPAEVSKWKPIQNTSGSSPPLQLTYSPVMGGMPHAPDSPHLMTDPQVTARSGSRGGTPSSNRRRTDNMSKSNPKVPADRIKYRIHQVKDADFKNTNKVDGRRRRAKGKDRGVTLAPQPQLSEESPLPRLEGASKRTGPEQEKPESLKAAVPTTLGQDDNYGLNILAAMSSIQRRENNGSVVPVSSTVPTTRNSPLTVGTSDAVDADKLPSPVSLAGAQSLLLLGNDVQSPEKEKATESEQPLNVESSIVDSLLKLSSSVPSQSKKVEDNGSSLEVDANTFVVQGRETRSASYSAAEAMLLMVETDKAEKENGKQTATEEVFNTSLSQEGVSDDEQDSEATDTDSEATLTPSSPTMKVPRRQITLDSVSDVPTSTEQQESDSSETRPREESPSTHSLQEPSAQPMADDHLDVVEEHTSPPTGAVSSSTDILDTESDHLLPTSSLPEKDVCLLNTPPSSSPLQPVAEEQTQSLTVVKISTTAEARSGFLDSPDSMDITSVPADSKADSSMSETSHTEKNERELTPQSDLDEAKGQDCLNVSKVSDEESLYTHSVPEDDKENHAGDVGSSENNQTTVVGSTSDEVGHLDQEDGSVSPKPDQQALPSTEPITSSQVATNVLSHGNRLPSWSAFADEAVTGTTAVDETKLSNSIDEHTSMVSSETESKAALGEDEDILELRISDRNSLFEELASPPAEEEEALLSRTEDHKLESPSVVSPTAIAAEMEPFSPSPPTSPIKSKPPNEPRPSSGHASPPPPASPSSVPMSGIKEVISPIVAPQNRLSGSWKSGSKFERFQQRKGGLTAKPEEKHAKKRVKPHQDLTSKNKRLFDVDSPPPPSHTQSPSKSNWKERPPKEKKSEYPPHDALAREEQKLKSRLSPGLSVSTPSSKRSKLDRSRLGGSHAPSRPHDSHSDHDSRLSQPGSDRRSYSREPSKPRSRPPSRQSNRTSRSPVPLGHSNRSPPPSNPKEYSPFSDDDHLNRSSSGPRHASHDSHMRSWNKKDRSPDYSKDRMVSHKHSKRRDSHQVPSRRHHDDSHTHRKNKGHHHYSREDGSAADIRSFNGKGESRRQSYESVSEEEISYDHSQRDRDTERRVGQEGRGVTGPTPSSGVQNERKRSRPEHLDSESVMLEHHHNKVARVTTPVKHKKYKHSKEHVEKWRKADSPSGKMKAHKH